MEYKETDTENARITNTGKTIPLGVLNQAIEEQKEQNQQQELPIDLTILEPKVEQLNNLLKEQNPKGYIDQYNLLMTIGFTNEELAWLAVIQMGKAKEAFIQLLTINQQITQFLQKS